MHTKELKEHKSLYWWLQALQVPYRVWKQIKFNVSKEPNIMRSFFCSMALSSRVHNCGTAWRKLEPPAWATYLLSNGFVLESSDMVRWNYGAHYFHHCSLIIDILSRLNTCKQKPLSWGESHLTHKWAERVRTLPNHTAGYFRLTTSGKK